MAKSKPTLNLVTHAATSSSAVRSPTASKNRWVLIGTCHSDWKSTGRPVAREHNSDAASSSPEKKQELLNLHENLKSTRKLVENLEIHNPIV